MLRWVGLILFLVAAALAAQVVRSGPNLPAKCASGETFFKTNAPKAQAWYACVDGAWKQDESRELQMAAPAPQQTSPQSAAVQAPPKPGAVQPASQQPAESPKRAALVTSSDARRQPAGLAAAAGAAMNSSGGGDWVVTRTSPKTLAIGAGCSAATPCSYRFGAAVRSLTAPVTVTLSKVPVTQQVFLYLSPAGGLVVGGTAGLVGMCEGACSIRTGITAFPPGSIPLYQWTAKPPDEWAESGLDRRTALSAPALQTGLGLTMSENPLTGGTKFELDRTVVGVRVPAPKTANASCAQGAWAADAQYFYLCVAANTWRRAALSAW